MTAFATDSGPAAETVELSAENTGGLNCYLPRVLLERLAQAPEEPVLILDGTAVFVDVSGFTQLSERLARAGQEGAEHLTDTISACFSALLAEAYAVGGSLLKFGGDALLVWFAGEDHAVRACAAAAAMRRTLREIGRVRAGASNIVLRMSAGVHSGAYEMFLVGTTHREYVVSGPAVRTVVGLEHDAGTGQILISEQTAALLPQRCRGISSGSGILLARAPLAPRTAGWVEAAALPPDEAVAACLSTALRAHLRAGPALPEHRMATIAFLQFGELDAAIAAEGADGAASALAELVGVAQAAADRYEVCILGSDVAADGGKLLFSAGAPRAIGNDEERMLLAMRDLVDAQTRLPIRIGVNRGHVFTGEVGPAHRRTYTVMGDVVNLAARLMAKAPWGAIYATEPVLLRAARPFAVTAVAPFMVKGKRRPVNAVSVGAPLRGAVSRGAPQRLPLIGRDRELAALHTAITEAAGGRGSLVELIGDTGSGTSRLLAEARTLAEGMRTIGVMCDGYTQAIPYGAWRELFRHLLDLDAGDPEDAVLARLRARVEATDRALLPWLPLLAVAAGVEAPSTRDVDELSVDARAAKLHDTVLRLLAGSLSVPTLLAIEQLDFMDLASAALLAALAERLGASSWLVVGTRRDREAGFVAGSGPVARVEVGPLDPEAALALAEATPEADLLPPHTIALAIERADGNPEFLLDLLAAAASGSAELPETIEAAASARIDALEPGDRALLRRAAVLGLRFRADRMRHVLEPAATEPDEPTWARLSDTIRSDADGYLRFTSPIVCEAAYAGLPFGLRRRLHAAVGEALERDLGRDVDADPAILSLHFSRAGDHDRAWRYAVLGAERASARFAVADAAALYRRAIEVHRGATVAVEELAGAWESLGESLTLVGEIPAAERALASARRLLAGDPIAEARICFRRGQIAERKELSSAVRWMQRGLRMVEGLTETDARRWRARLVAELAWIRQRQQRYLDAERLCREALAEGAASGALRAEARAAYTLDWALFELGRSQEATHSARALEIYRELGDPEQEGRVLNNLGGFAYWRGNWQEAIDLYRAAGECSKRAGHSADVAFTDGNVGEILADQGYLADAAVHLRRARRVWLATGHRHGTAFADMLLGRIEARAGRTPEALAALHRALADMEQFRVDFYADFARALIAEAEALGGDPERALALTERHLAAGSGNASLLRRARGIALARRGDVDAAAAELRLAVGAARDRGEEFDVALGVDALAAIGVADEAVLAERDAILSRLGVRALPVIAVLAPSAASSP